MVWRTMVALLVFARARSMMPMNTSYSPGGTPMARSTTCDLTSKK